MKRTSRILIIIISISISNCNVRHEFLSRGQCASWLMNQDSALVIVDQNRYPVNVSKNQSIGREYHVQHITFKTLYVVPKNLYQDTSHLVQQLGRISRYVFSKLQNNSEFAHVYSQKNSYNGFCKSHLWDEDFEKQLNESNTIQKFNFIYKAKNSKTYTLEYELKYMSMSEVIF